MMNGEDPPSSRSPGRNPFDDDDEDEDDATSLCASLEPRRTSLQAARSPSKTAKHMSELRKSRAAFISGHSPNEVLSMDLLTNDEISVPEQPQQDDLESCSPDNDFASRAPSLLSTNSPRHGLRPASSRSGSSSESSPMQSFASSVKSKAASVSSQAASFRIPSISVPSFRQNAKESRYKTKSSVGKMRYGTNLSPHADDDDDLPGRRKCIVVGLVIFSVILVGAIIAVAVVIFGGGDSAAGSSNNPSPDAVARAQTLDKILVRVSSAAQLEDPMTAQAKARHWLLYEDSLWMHPTQAIPGKRVIQRYILVVLYFATGGQSTWTDNNWLQGDECSNADGDYWTGVACNNDGEVLAIAFDYLGLTGMLPPELGYLSTLENLIIKDEKVSGTVPSTFGSLTNLRQLGLYRNFLTGAIPDEIGQMTKLSYLNLQGNKLEGTFPSLVASMTELRTLVLANNKFFGTIPFESLSNTQLQYLGLSQNAFTGIMPSSIAKLSGLEYLYLENNKLRGTLPTDIAGATLLKSLDLDQNEFIGSLPLQALGKLSNLQYLSLAMNNFTGELLLNETVALDSVVTLNIAGNRLGGPLPDFSYMSGLVNLFIQSNQFSGTIHSTISSLQRLEIIFMSGNKLQGTVPSTISSNSQLRGLYLSANSLSGPLPTSLCSLTGLEALFLDENQFNGTIPDCIGDLSGLKQLHLFQNQLTGQVPSSLGQLRQIDEIGLEGNKLNGTMSSIVCDAVDALGVKLWADCGGSDTSISCPCCTVCCFGAGACEARR